ncbi:MULTISPECIES: hypothetical protein [Clostridium]|uniref:hypothetical protein n=1 Tax=Clostridium TaxID=1485 RepID=UPI00069EEBF6|nr:MULTISPECIES: hypothetical protein [Clostridium]KOF57264.1 Zn-finger containing protein [Clostridium sp. DMHC 10]MCD2347596.1 hypothetical protein [Clostridium guangxiense]
MNKLRDYFRGSYGVDKFSKYLYAIGAILLFTKYTAVIGFALIIFSTIRSISKNIYSRQRELKGFENFLNGLQNKFHNFKPGIGHSSQYKIFKCPNCSQKLRVPKKQGKIVITCKKCGTSFKKRT